MVLVARTIIGDLLSENLLSHCLISYHARYWVLASTYEAIYCTSFRLDIAQYSCIIRSTIWYYTVLYGLIQLPFSEMVKYKVPIDLHDIAGTSTSSKAPDTTGSTLRH